MKLRVVFADTRKPAFAVAEVVDTAAAGGDAGSVAALRAVVAANAGAAKGGRAAALRDDRRIRLSCVPPEGQKRGAVLQANKALEDFGLKDGDTVLVKVRDRVIAARRRAIGPRVPSAPRRGRPIARRLPLPGPRRPRPERSRPRGGP